MTSHRRFRLISVGARKRRNVQRPVSILVVVCAAADISIAAAQRHRQATVAGNGDIGGTETDRAVIEVDLLAEDVSLQRLDQIARPVPAPATGPSPSAAAKT
ncbi:hypothetical protein G6F35_017560 [Rhizopus arrhizus]|nr:hypothetical protein G6F35_017560 [Rhizopus arrhizus]